MARVAATARARRRPQRSISLELADPSDQSVAQRSSGPTSASRSAGVRSFESVSPRGARVTLGQDDRAHGERSGECSATHFVDADDDFSTLDESSFVGE